MRGMHELDTEDVEWINISGNHWRGKDIVYKDFSLVTVLDDGLVICEC